jgi:hypothetical protein
MNDSMAGEGERRAVLERANGAVQELWFRRSDGPLDPSVGADPFLLGTLLLWMADGAPVHVHGPVSRRLLAGLDEWQAAWSLWRPDRYKRVAVTVDEVVDTVPASATAVTAFSGGVDAGYTVRRHLTGDAGWQTVDLRAAMLVHGFDVPLSQPEIFARAQDRALKMLAGTDLKLVSFTTNLRDLGQDWEDGFGLAVSACLTLLAPEYGVGLVGSSEPYDHLVLPWGSNPATDHLCSTGLMDIRHDGAGASRTDKVRLLAEWPEASEHIRVCWQGDRLDRNCGRCEKCVRTILNFRAAGAGLPACFDEDASNAVIRRTVLRNTTVVAEWRTLVDAARSAGLRGSWLDAAEFAIRRGKSFCQIKESRPGKALRAYRKMRGS